MAVNSIRERLIVDIEAVLNEIPSIQTVKRKKLGFDELQGITGPQLPYIAIVAGLPVPEEVKWSGRIQGKIGKFISRLTLQLTVYGLENVSPDQEISNLADDIWAKLYDNYNRNGLALSTLVKHELETGIFDPYFAFNMEVEIVYVHDTSSI